MFGTLIDVYTQHSTTPTFQLLKAATHVRLLAVLSGQEPQGSSAMDRGMKNATTMGSCHRRSYKTGFLLVWVSEIKKYIDAGYFDHIRHIHLLGTTEPGVAVMPTALKRALRKYLKCEEVRDHIR